MGHIRPILGYIGIIFLALSSSNRKPVESLSAEQFKSKTPQPACPVRKLESKLLTLGCSVTPGQIAYVLGLMTIQ